MKSCKQFIISYLYLHIWVIIKILEVEKSSEVEKLSFLG